MNVFVIGATGFIGYPAVLELLKRGHAVSGITLALPPNQPPLPPQVHITLGDYNKLSDAELSALLAGHKALVFAAGADDRVTPRAPAYPFFYRANVVSAVRVFRLARQAGIRRAVVMSSYFVHFARIWPELHLAVRHPYIRSRVEQQAEVRQVALPDLEVMFLELPYIFGVTPGLRPLWQPLIRYAASPWPLFYPRGGTNMVAVQHVAEAVAGALEQGTAGASYLVGDENRTWAQLLGSISRLAGKPKRVITVPDWLVAGLLRLVKLQHRLQGREGGLDPTYFTALQTAETYFDPTPSSTELGYGRGGLDEALAATVQACLSTR
ncbi:MAG: NAD(P)H-binding protein [Anaerolineae bacterium]